MQIFLNRSDVSEELRRSLGQGYGPFKDTLVRCEASLSQIVQEIKGLVPGSKVSLPSPKRPFVGET